MAAWRSPQDRRADVYFPELHTEASTVAWLRTLTASHDGEIVGIFRRGQAPGEEAPIGGIVLLRDSRYPAVVELRFFLRAAHRGQGFATEAVDGLLRWLFAEGEVHKVTGFHMVDDPAPGRVMQRVGMRREGIWREQLLYDGVWQDVIGYGMLAWEMTAATEVTQAAAVDMLTPVAAQTAAAEIYTDGELSLRRLDRTETHVLRELLPLLRESTGRSPEENAPSYSALSHLLSFCGPTEGGVYLLREGEVVIGLFCLLIHPASDEAPFPGQVHFALRPQAQGRGCATRGMRLLLRAARRLPVAELKMVTPRRQVAALMAQLHNGAYIDHEDEQAFYTCLSL